MNEEKSQSHLFLRLILRYVACIGIGLATSLGLFWIFIWWCIQLFPLISSQSQTFILIFINLALFLGACLAGYLSLTLKRSIVTTSVIAIILGILFVGFISGIVLGIINIICIVLGGLIGGGLLQYLRDKLTEKN